MPGLRRRAVLAAVAVLGLTLGGCSTGTPSALAPDQSVTVSGRVIGAAGKPSGGTAVALYRQPGLGETLGNLFVIVASVGLACLENPPPALCRDARRSVTAADGTFSFAMKGRDTYEGGGTNAATFQLSTAAPARSSNLTGADTTVTFRIQSATLAVPDLRFWEPALTYAGTGAQGHLGFTAAPTNLGDGPVYEAEFEDRDGNLVWAYPGVQPQATLDARYLEDHAGGVAVHARPHQAGPATTFDFDYRSPSTAFRGSAGVPLTRRRACFIDDGSGNLLRAEQPCRLTDGDLATVFRPPPGACPSPATTPPSPRACPVPLRAAPIVDLGASARLDLVAVHGCRRTCVVEVSDDRASWRPAGGLHSGDNRYLANGLAGLPLAGGTHGRYLRVSFEDGAIERLTEVSAWGPAGQALPPPTEAPRAAPPSSVLGGHAFTNRADGAGVSGWLVAAIAVLVGVVLLLLVWVLRLRRRLVRSA